MSQLPAEWLNWTQENIERGCDLVEIREILLRHGFPDAAIAHAVGAARRARSDDAVGSVDYKALAEVSLTHRDHRDLRRVSTDRMDLYVWDDFLEPSECSQIMAVADPLFMPSTITVDDPDPAFRTSETCHFKGSDVAIVGAIDRKIADALGVTLSYSEPIQAQRYAIGQEFKAHTDYFEPNTKEFEAHAATLGQRTWTFMIYLNDTPSGGETWFCDADQWISPKRGRAVIWNNLYPDGRPNPRTIHQGMKVREGYEFIITKWFRDRGQEPMLASERMDP